MATLTLFDATSSGCQWEINYFGSIFSYDNYKRAGVTRYSFSDGASSISGILDYEYPNNQWWTGGQLSLSPGSYKLYGFAQAANGLYYRAGSDSITITAPQLSTPDFKKSSRTANSITISYSSVSNADRYDIKCNNGFEASPREPTYTFTNLSPNTQYSFQCRARDLHGDYATSDWSSWTRITTLGPPDTPSGVYLSSRVEGGLSVYWNSISDATSYILEYKYSYSSAWSSVSTSKTSYTITGRAFGVTHDFRVKARNSAGDSSFSVINIATTAPKTPTISLSGATNSSISIKMSNMQDNWDAVDITLNRITKSVTTNNQTVTFTGLTKGQTYTATAKSRFYVNDTTLYSVNTDSIRVSTKSRPSYFAWTTSKVSGQAFNLTAQEWNRLIQNVKDVHIYKLGSYDSSDYPMTTVSSGQQFLAAYFNQVRFAIGSLKSTGIGTKYSGDKIYARDLNTLRDRLNAVE